MRHLLAHGAVATDRATVVFTGGGASAARAGGTWQHDTPRGWTFRERSTRHTLTGIATEDSVTPWAGQFPRPSQDSTQSFRGQIRGCPWCSSVGPFTGRNEICRMPGRGPYGSCGAGDIIAGNPPVHPEVSSGDTVTPTSDRYREPGIHRPRSFRFPLG